jgi:hypothetical protein
MNWSFHLSLQANPRWLETVDEVAAAAARQAGEGPGDAARIGQTVAAAVRLVMAASAGTGEDLALQFDARDGRLDVRLRYVPDTLGAGDVAISRGSLDSVEFSREGRFTVCCLSRKLPD